MQQFVLGVIRVVTYDKDENIQKHGKIIESLYPQIKTVSSCIHDQPKGIFDDASEQEAIPKILELVKNYQNVDGILISCVADPGLQLARSIRQDIPIIGAGESAITLASRIGNKLAVIGITDNLPNSFLKFESKIISYAKPPNINSTLDINTDKGIKELICTAETQKALHEPSAIVFACTGMANSGIAIKIEKSLNIPVVDPLIAAGACALFDMVSRSNWQT